MGVPRGDRGLMACVCSQAACQSRRRARGGDTLACRPCMRPKPSRARRRGPRAGKKAAHVINRIVKKR